MTICEPDQRREGAAVDRGAGELGLHRGDRVAIADPDAGGDVRGRAAEPGVAVVVGGPGLAPGRLAVLGPAAGAGGDHGREDVRDRGRDRRVDDLLGDRLVLAAGARLVGTGSPSW